MALAVNGRRGRRGRAPGRRPRPHARPLLGV